jgi:hypothetical protein
MLQNLKNLFKLCRILKARGNWPFIRKSKKQLWDFFICRNGLIQKPFFLPWFTGFICSRAWTFWFGDLKPLGFCSAKD